VISENSKTFGTVKAHENIIRDSLEQMVHAIFELAVHYGLTYKGQSIESLIAGGYNVAVTFDDSIIEDKNAEINRGVMMVGSGLMSRKKFLIDVLGYTPEEAENDLEEIGKESKRINAVEVTRLFGNMS
jgi:A118 family predicted phage portal protein